MGLHETSRVRLSAPNGLVFRVEGGGHFYKAPKAGLVVNRLQTRPTSHAAP